jgi:hypothetical protein
LVTSRFAAEDLEISYDFTTKVDGIPRLIFMIFVALRQEFSGVNIMSNAPIEVWIAMNEDGEYVVAKDEDDAVDLFNDECGGISRRMIRLRVTMAPPEVAEIDVDVPHEAGATVKTGIG